MQLPAKHDDLSEIDKIDPSEFDLDPDFDPAIYVNEAPYALRWLLARLYPKSGKSKAKYGKPSVVVLDLKRSPMLSHTLQLFPHLPLGAAHGQLQASGALPPSFSFAACKSPMLEAQRNHYTNYFSSSRTHLASAIEGASITTDVTQPRAALELCNQLFEANLALFHATGAVVSFGTAAKWEIASATRFFNDTADFLRAIRLSMPAL